MECSNQKNTPGKIPLEVTVQMSSMSGKGQVRWLQLHSSGHVWIYSPRTFVCFNSFLTLATG